MKKGMVNAVILALVLINTILSAVIVFAIVPAMNKTTTLVESICEKVDLNIGNKTGGGSSETGQPSITDLSGVQISFNDSATTTIALTADADGEQHYVKMSATINLNTLAEDYETVSAAMATVNDILADDIISIVGSYTYSQASNGIDDIKAAVLDKIKQEFNSDCIYSVTFSTFTLN